MSDFWAGLPTLSRRAAIASLVALGACLFGAFAQPATFFESWLVTWLFLVGIALAAMMDVMIHELTGGEWGWSVRPCLEAAMLTLPLLTLLAIPLAVGLPHLFEWARTDVVARSELLQQKQWYLNVPEFIVRNGIWLVVWSGFALLLRKRLTGSTVADVRARKRLAVGGLLIYIVSVTFFAYDWIASLVPAWSSTAVGLRLGVAQFVAAFGFAIPFAAYRSRGTGTSSMTARDSGDLGNLLLTFAMMWAYIAFTQYLIIWGEDLPAETSWFAPRVQTTWWWLGLAVGSLNFGLPVLAMLFRSVKRNPRILGIVCLLVLLGQWLDHVWLSVPSLRRDGFELHWLDLAALIAEGGLWLAVVSALATRIPDAVRVSPQAQVAHG